MKKLLIPGVIFVIVLFAAIFILGKTNKPKKNQEILPSPTQVLPTITDDIKVDLTATNNNRTIVLKISGLPKTLLSVEYELTYLTGERLPRGVLGKITTNGEDSVVRDDIVLGTCSSGKCVYDTGVESIDLSLKFNWPDKASVYQKTYSL